MLCSFFIGAYMNDRDNWVDQYNQGNSLRQIAETHNVSPATVRRELLQRGIQLRSSGGHVTFDPQIAVQLWNEGETLDTIAERMGVNRTAIYEQLKKLKINTNRSSLDTVKSLLSDGVPIDRVVECTGLSRNYVNRVAIIVGVNTQTLRDRQFELSAAKYTHLPVEQAISAITTELSIDKYSTGIKYFKLTGQLMPINVMRTSAELDRLIDNHRDELTSMIIAGDPLSSMMDRTTIPVTRIKQFINSSGIEYVPRDYRISQRTYQRLTNPKWCRAAFKRFGPRSPAQIVELLNYECGTDTVRAYFATHGIELNVLVKDYYTQLSDKQWLMDQYTTMSYAEIADIIGVSHPTVRDALISHGIEIKTESRVSKVELQLRQFIEDSYTGIKIYNDRTLIAPHEVDILLPDLNIAIEFCGIYWHSERFKPNNYHLDKLGKCELVGTRLVQIFEDEWMNNREVVKRKLLSIIGVHPITTYARKCSTVQGVSQLDSSQFLNQYHIQGADKSSIRIGLQFESRLVALMTFKRHGDGGVELNRFATSGSIPGAFSKLLSLFKKNYPYQYISTFADLRWSDRNNNVYLTHGFQLTRTTAPAYYYYNYKTKRLMHRMHFQRKHLPALLSDTFDPKLTERQNANKAGYWAVYDCGHLKYILHND